ncbi:MAG: polysaccharide deacetylase family protein [Alphaproteobacteria bacterium]|nr:polysaccharide deacetylase family protein [Alphaproteobacteria bacterium]
MKAIMYHYICPPPVDRPYATHLSSDNFCKQLDYFKQTDRFIASDEFDDIINSRIPVPDDGIVLTFDDGLKDHSQFVFPELLKRGLWGFFFVPTAIFTGSGLLAVHRIHYLLGRYGGSAIMEKMIGDEYLAPFLEKPSKFYQTTYRYQDNDEATVAVKRILNYVAPPFVRDAWLTKIMLELCDENQIKKDYYFTKEDMISMHAAGMIIGGHTVAHPVLGNLCLDEQRREIEDSLACLRGILGEKSVESFSFPYGRKATYTDETLQLLKDAECRYSFAVEHRNITAEDISNNILALPRWDCNQFSYGQLVK